MRYTTFADADKTVHKCTLLNLKAIQMMRYNIIEKARREICVLSLL
nr:MAG TPA: hypothetical protein [Caudoviricetes sp.]